MSTYTLTKTRFREGVWEGLLQADRADAPAPDITVTLDDKAIPGVTVAQAGEEARWSIEVPVPSEAIGDGVRTFLILDSDGNTVLDHFTLIAGEALGDDIRAEMALLRAELDMLKRAFRRHCLETT